MLQVNNYNSQILHNISFSLENNAIILGSNGSGKSTLAKVIAGIIESSSVSFYGKEYKELSNKQKTQTINYIPSKLEVFDEYMKVKEFLSLSFIDENDIKIEDLANSLKISHLLNHSCQTLSSGEAQLLLLASSIAHNAKITILDEPTANLDQIKTKQVFDILNNNTYLNKKIIITHDLNFAYKLGFDILYLKDGEILFQGQSAEFLSLKNLEKLFGSSVKIVENFVVSNL